MNELLAAAKAVIDRWDLSKMYVESPIMDELRAAVDRAENPPADYNEWTRQNSGKVLSAHEVWTAAQQADRERLKNVFAEVRDLKDPWIHYETLLEKIDA